MTEKMIETVNWFAHSMGGAGSWIAATFTILGLGFLLFVLIKIIVKIFKKKNKKSKKSKKRKKKV